MQARTLVLTTAYRHVIHEPAIEAGFDRFKAISGSTITYGAFCDVIAGLLAERLIREPVRLPEGALQCHWHLELTPAGTAEARRLIAPPAP